MYKICQVHNWIDFMKVMLRKCQFRATVRIKTAWEKRSVITVKGTKDKYDAVVRVALRKLPAKIDCSYLVKDDLADNLLNSNIEMLVTDGRDGSLFAKMLSKMLR